MMPVTLNKNMFLNNNKEFNYNHSHLNNLSNNNHQCNINQWELNNQSCNNINQCGNSQLKELSPVNQKFNNNQLLLADQLSQLLNNKESHMLMHQWKVFLFNQVNTKLWVDNNGQHNNNITLSQLTFLNKDNLLFYHNNHYNSINYQSMFKNKLDNKIPI